MLVNIPLSSGNKSYAIINKKATFAVAFLFLVRDMNLVLSRFLCEQGAHLPRLRQLIPSPMRRLSPWQ